MRSSYGWPITLAVVMIGLLVALIVFWIVLTFDAWAVLTTGTVFLVLVLVGVVGIVYATGTVSVAEVRDSRRAIDDVRANYLAEAGIERGMNFLGQAVRNTSMQNPLGGLTTLLGGGPITPFLGEPVMNGANQVGAYTVRMTQVAADATSVTIAIDASGYLPNAPSALGSNT